MKKTMYEEFKERTLVHGPCLKQLTELLCFDQILYPTTIALKRPRTLAPGYFGYPADEPLSEAVREKLTQAGFIVTPGTFFLDGDISSQQDLMERLEEEVKILWEAYYCILNTPATASEEAAWLQEIDSKTKILADFAVKRGKRAVAKFYADNVTKTLIPGWNLVISLMFRLPSVELGHVSIDDLIPFFSDEETRQRRHKLFDWIEGIEAAVEKGKVRVEEVPNSIVEFIADYNSWILQSGLSSGSTLVEFLFFFERDFIEKLVAVETTKEVNQILNLRPRGLTLTKEDMAISGRELAYISHSQRDYDYTSVGLPPGMKVQRQGW